MSNQVFNLTGLTCSACKRVTEKRIGSVAGVKQVEVNVASGKVNIEADREVTKAEIEKVFQGTPYQITE
jgi:copper chaperone CopZ